MLTGIFFVFIFSLLIVSSCIAFFSLLLGIYSQLEFYFIHTNTYACTDIHSNSNIIQCMGRWNLEMPTLQNKLLSRTSMKREFSVAPLNFQNDSHPFVRRLYILLFTTQNTLHIDARDVIVPNGVFLYFIFNFIYFTLEFICMY